jgi:CubicO group peptidase (beta-lactamase class C family)
MIKQVTVITLLAATSAAHAAPFSPSACAAAASYSAERDGASFLVMRDGKIVCENYAGGAKQDVAHLLASGTKSFTGIMAAAAAQDGFLSLDELVSATITEWKADARQARVTIRQLLGLISGMPGGTLGASPSYAEAIATPLSADPGQVFQYGPAPFQVFGEVMKRKLAARGAKADPLDYLTRRILDPLGIKPAMWRRGPDGNPNMPAGAALTAHDWATIGEFMRLGGKWQGKQLVDPATLAQLTRSGPVNASYGISWWVEGARGSADARDPVSATVDLTRHAAELPPGIFLAAGTGNQRLYVIPSERLVVVRQAENRSRAERRQRNQQRREALVQQGASPEEAREALWSDAAFLKLVLGLK